MYQIRAFAFFVITMVLLSSPALHAAIHWSSADFTVNMGTVLGTRDALTVKPDAEGQVFISLAVQNLELEHQPILTVHFADPWPGGELFVIWQAAASPGEFQQVRLPRVTGNSFTISMAETPGWSGEVMMLALRMEPAAKREISLRTVSLSSPSLLSRARDLVYDWSSFKPWHPADINRYPGTRTLHSGAKPVPIFAGVLGSGLICYIVYLLLVRRLRDFDWRFAGVLVLVCWIALDMFWQLRLARQLQATHTTFADKSPGEKLLASEDRPFVQIATRAKAQILHENARVFIASASDRTAMRSAYYMAPLNTFWHRKGPELPDRRFFLEGDYILIVQPSALNYDNSTRRLTLPKGDSLSVDPLLHNTQSTLLRVSQGAPHHEG